MLKANSDRQNDDQPITTASQTNRSKLNTVLLLGRGRSGTTWLAQMMNSYEHCSYKHEPFLRKKSTDYNTWLQQIESGDAKSLRSEYEAICRRAYHGVDMPPFPPKSFRNQNGQLLHLLYGLGKRVDAIKPLYEWYGKMPLTERTPVLIKDVNFPNHLLPRLCEAIEPYMLAVARNPFANIASYLKGVELSLFGQSQKAKVESVRQLLESPNGERFSQYLDRLDGMSLAQFEALTWRIGVEPLVEFARSYDRGLVVVYDDVCLDPHGKIAEIFDFVGWEVGQSTRDFIDRSISGEKSSANSDKAYYSVYRDPRQSMSKWKTQLTDEQVADIASVIRESPLTDLWPDMPL
ncbi:sulfotransferase domain-containing protein [Oscillatoriales cyanobacterium LEGE 11467]|uniref:Sulfotransferase domain-containing protein n=1 Tax=Zarconia navalis LEGE 11467 TaxID=1828826 RepID=A0A928VVS2_9CYAN|nr:sulfotransferase domain-containing protein [Zarconia navalis]MBE9041142.1 sulfotransferase domain-containing protein [Zarconia navalis LEGE 11467]